MKNLAHSASFQSFDKDAPSKPGTKHLSFEMIDARKFVRGRRKGKLKESMGPGALRRNGALFRGQRNFWDVADDKSEAKRLAFASGAADVRQRCSERPSALAYGAAMAFDPVAPGSFSGPAESWLPRLSAAPWGIGRRLRRLSSLPVHDDVDEIVPQGRGCQITIRAQPDQGREKASPVRSPLPPPRSPSC